VTRRLTQKILFRRIRRSEEQLLHDFCKNNRTAAKYYRSHNEWLKKAVNDIASLERVVFGVFDTFFQEGENPSHELIGCVFLKLSKYQNSIELKNLILPESKRHAHTLIAKAIRFCEIRNIEKIEIEIPQAEHELVSLFLEYNFRLVALRERYNNPTILVCILERTIGDKFYGDPFNTTKLGLWLLKQFIPCESIAVDYDNNIEYITFKSKSFSPAFSSANKIGSSKLLKGTLWILEESNEIDDDILFITSRHCSGPYLKLVLSEFPLSRQQKKKLSENGFIHFDRHEIMEIAGGKLSSLNIPFTTSDVGGIVTVLEKEEILRYAMKPSLTYYLFGIARELDRGLATDDDSKPSYGIEHELNDFEDEVLAIYCTNWDNKPGIVGYYVVERSSSMLFHELLKQKTPTDTALSKTDLTFYSTFSEKEPVTVANCKELFIFNTPLQIIDGQWTSTKQVNEYLKNELITNGNNMAYLDYQSCLNLKKLKNEQLKQEEEMFESIAAAIGILANFTQITSFTQEQIEKLKKAYANADESAFKQLQDTGLMNVINSHIERINKLIAKYNKIDNIDTFSEFDKQECASTLSARIVELLELAEPFKDIFPDYDMTIAYFKGVKGKYK